MRPEVLLRLWSSQPHPCEETEVAGEAKGGTQLS